jgi:hypothetical protein
MIWIICIYTTVETRIWTTFPLVCRDSDMEYCLRRDVQQWVDRGSMQKVFNAVWLILQKERTIIRIKNLVNTLTKFNLIKRLLTLFAPILLHHVRLGWSSPFFPMLSLPLLGTDCLSLPFLEGRARPRPPHPRWPHFPQTPGNSPPSHQAQVEFTIACTMIGDIFRQGLSLSLNYCGDWRAYFQ